MGPPISEFILSSGNRGQETYLAHVGLAPRGCTRDAQPTSSKLPEALGLSLRNCSHPEEEKAQAHPSFTSCSLCSSNSLWGKPTLFPGPWPQGGSSRLSFTQHFKEAGSCPLLHNSWPCSCPSSDLQGLLWSPLESVLTSSVPGPLGPGHQLGQRRSPPQVFPGKARTMNPHKLARNEALGCVSPSLTICHLRTTDSKPCPPKDSYQLIKTVLWPEDP